MATTWAILKAQVRRLLKDEDPTRYRYSEAQLLDNVAWALDALCSHTAIITASAYTVDTDTTFLTLPDNVYEPIDRSGSVIHNNGTKNSYINPVRTSRVSESRSGYYLQPQNILNFVDSVVPGTVTVNYFATYPHPSQESDQVLIPNWATAAIVLKTAAYALAPYAYRSANVRQWNSKDDSGRPTDNPLQEMAEAFNLGFDAELRNFPPQQRENYFQK